MVSKTWNQFLTQQRSIWMNFLRKIEPYLYYVDNLVYSHLNTEGTMGKVLTQVLVGNSDWKNVFDSIEEQGKIEDIIDAFMSIQGFAVHGWGNSKYFTAGEYWPGEPPKIAEIFERSLIGEKFDAEVLPCRRKTISRICKNSAKYNEYLDTDEDDNPIDAYARYYENKLARLLGQKLEKRIRTNFKLIPRQRNPTSFMRRRLGRDTRFKIKKAILENI